MRRVLTVEDCLRHLHSPDDAFPRATLIHEIHEFLEVNVSSPATAYVSPMPLLKMFGTNLQKGCFTPCVEKPSFVLQSRTQFSIGWSTSVCIPLR